MTHGEARVRDYPHLRKVDGAFVVNSDNSEYARAIARRRQEKNGKELVLRVESLEKKMDQILALLTQREK